MTAKPFVQDARMDQFFMTDADILEKIASFADLGKGDRVLEIGAGQGDLTKVLAARCGSIVAIERDERLKPYLKKRLRGAKNVRLLFGNALEMLESHSLKYDKMVSNPPYSISEPLIMLLFRQSFSLAVLTLPAKFAERLTACPGDRLYTRLSFFTQLFFRAEELLLVDKEAWSPVPDTDGIVVRLTPSKPSGTGEMIARELALQQDKKLKNALSEAIVRSCGSTKRQARQQVLSSGLPKAMLSSKVSGLGLNDIKRVLSKM